MARTAEEIRVALEERGLLETAQEIALKHRVRLEDMLGGDRHMAPSLARHAFWLELRRIAYSLPQIGALFGVHHTTVMSALRRFPAEPKEGATP